MCTLSWLLGLYATKDQYRSIISFLKGKEKLANETHIWRGPCVWILEERSCLKVEAGKTWVCMELNDCEKLIIDDVAGHDREWDVQNDWGFCWTGKAPGDTVLWYLKFRRGGASRASPHPRVTVQGQNGFQQPQPGPRPSRGSELLGREAEEQGLHYSLLQNPWDTLKMTKRQEQLTVYCPVPFCKWKEAWVIIIM